MKPYQRQFIEFALNKQVLKFGEFTLKSGRKSPYFFNAGLFDDGAKLGRLAGFYAERLIAPDLPEKFEMTVRANLTAEQAALYRAVVAEMLRHIAESIEDFSILPGAERVHSTNVRGFAHLPVALTLLGEN